jgi:hypothetical protein
VLFCFFIYSLRKCLNKAKWKNFLVKLHSALSHGCCWSCTRLCLWDTVWFRLYCYHIHGGIMCMHLFTILVILCSFLGHSMRHLWRSYWSYGSQKEHTKSKTIWQLGLEGMILISVRKHSVFTFMTVPGLTREHC